jgi:hypothetical protein
MPALMSKTRDGKAAIYTPDRDPYRDAGDKPMVLLLVRMLMSIVAGHCWIQDREDVTKLFQLIIPRIGQLRLYRNCVEQALQGKPIRQCIPKYRRHGISTVIQYFFRFKCKVWPHQEARTVAQSDEATKGIFKITKTMHRMDGGREDKKGDASSRISFPEMHSQYQCRSAMGEYAGSGDTLTDVHVSEVAKFKYTSEQDKKAMYSLMNAVSQTSPLTSIFLESSGQGSHGAWPDRARAAYRGEGTYGCVFLPWVLDPELADDENLLPDEFDPPLAGHEITLKESHGATDGQIAWRRNKLADEFPGIPPSENPPAFAWDYPLVLEDCFIQRSGRVFPMFSRDKHEGVMSASDFSLKAYRTRFIDWGASENHAFVCLWVWIDPSKSPQLIVHPDCKKTIEQHLNLGRDARTGQPLKIDDHTTDALRIGIVSKRVEGLIYVYQELYITDFSDKTPQGIARTIHKMSGFRHPRGDKDPDLTKYRAAVKGEKFDEGVADRSNKNMIDNYTASWGIPMAPHILPHRKDKKVGEVEDGIAIVQTIMGADANFRTTAPNVQGQLLDSAMAKLYGPGRRRLLTKAERKAFEKEDRGPGPKSSRLDYTGVDLALYGS